MMYGWISKMGKYGATASIFLSRACLKNHSRNLHAPLCGIFHPNSVAVARYGALIRAKYPTNCDAHLAESLFQTRSNGAYILLIYMFTVFSDMRTVRSEVIL